MNGSYHQKRAYQLLELKRYEAAIQEAMNLLKYWPRSRSAYEIISRCLCKLERYGEAIIKIKEGLAIHPDNSLLICYLGEIYWEKQEFEKAKTHLKEAIRISPNNSYYYYKLAACYNRVDELTYANELIDISLKLDPVNTSAIAFKSQLEAHLKEEGLINYPSKEKELIENALSKNPESAHLHFVKGVAHWRDKEFEKAEVHLREVLARDMNNAEARNLVLECQARNHPFWTYLLSFFPTGRNFISVTAAISFVFINLFNWKFYLEALDGKMSTVYFYSSLLFLIPFFTFWIIRPWLRFKSFGKKLGKTTWEVANPATPIEVMQFFVILSSILLYFSYSTFSLLSCLLATIISLVLDMSIPSKLNTFYPVFKRPIQSAIISSSLFIGIIGIGFFTQSPKPEVFLNRATVNVLDFSNGQWASPTMNLDFINKDSVTVLILDFNKLEEIPKEIAQFPNTVYLSLSYNYLIQMSNTLSKLPKLKYLELNGNSLLIFDGGIQYLKSEFPEVKIIQYNYDRNKLLIGKSFEELKQMGNLPD